ncbi:RluA family pseudouridine synthase [Fusibacter sp. 3D3]|uniref:RluA family pseudouridine synthase n=1 Tax=Fusibacter sp. 3D3 TaxID=1048380 RepID=UPI000853DA9F|nr:RNA pseudouridine synthase [Fusibacter sp. 3D3]GAU77586.1 similar to tRNA pseudouridine synthase C [Fusibacter sp. 3D3]
MNAHIHKKSIHNAKNNLIPEILYEDQNLLVVVKPQNLPMQPDRNATVSLLTLLEDYFEFSRGIEDPFIGLVHRLDRHTGGICIFAKTPSTLKQLNQSFSDHKVEKRYITVVSDPIDTLETSGTLTHYLTIDTKSNYVTAFKTASQGTLKAKLHYKKIAHMDSAYGPLSLLEIILETGRQHQIRVQLSSIGYPVMGDAKYGKCPIQGESLALWAYALNIGTHHFMAMPTFGNLYFKIFESYLLEENLNAYPSLL